MYRRFYLVCPPIFVARSHRTEAPMKLERNNILVIRETQNKSITYVLQNTLNYRNTLCQRPHPFVAPPPSQMAEKVMKRFVILGDNFIAKICRPPPGDSTNALCRWVRRGSYRRSNRDLRYSRLFGPFRSVSEGHPPLDPRREHTPARGANHPQVLSALSFSPGMCFCSQMLLIPDIVGY